ncbi:MAG: sugar transferase [Ignavibacteriaceae bacterium]|nr:sugar transferase [Ignavibacteriaceae bacterium]
MYYYSKRILDVFVSAAAVVLLMPVYIIIVMIILLTSGAPVFFYQERIGQNWKPFRIIKFRTMVKNADKIGLGITSASDERITPAGRILRKYKLDELPQFINVLKGDMSLIGPRPELLKYINFYREDYSAILNIKPGITDYAAIKFRDEESLLVKSNKEESYINKILPSKIILYKRYLNEMGFLTDVKILLNTVKVIIL